MQQISKLLELDTKYIDSFQSDTIPPGIPRLCRAILISALEDVARKNQYSMGALKWIYSNDTSYIFSFSSVCAILRLDPAKVRNAIDTDYLSFF